MIYTEAEVREAVERASRNLNERIAELERELAEARSQRDDLDRALREIGMVATVALDGRDEPEPEPEGPPTPLEAGVEAARAGLALDANPYPKGHAPHGQWRAGWISEVSGGRR